MTEMILSRYAGWSAFLSAIATIFGAVTLALFSTSGQPWGTVNDITIIVLAVSMLDVLLVLHRLHRHSAPVFSLIAYVIGVLGMIMGIAFQVMVLFGALDYEQTTIIVPIGFGLLGVSLICYSCLAFARKTLPRGMVILGLIAGIGYVLVIVGLIVSDLQEYLPLTGGLLAAIFYPLWAIWFGRLIFSGELTL